MAHKALKPVQKVIPLIGLPGVGYEAVVKATKLPFRLGDSYGSRQAPNYPHEWSYDVSYVWRKALQASEIISKFEIWSFGGDNSYELLSLRWPVALCFTRLPVDLWLERANAFRKSVGLSPIKRHSTMAATYIRKAASIEEDLAFYESLPGGKTIHRLDPALPIRTLSEEVRSIVKAIVPQKSRKLSDVHKYA